MGFFAFSASPLSTVKAFDRRVRRENLRRTQRKAKGRIAPPFLAFQLLRCEFLGLAFGTHEFERALGLFVGLRDFLLHLGRSLFHFWREAHIAVILHAGA